MVSRTTAFLAATGARLPVVQAPMAGSAGAVLAAAAIAAGGIGSLACAMLSAEAAAAEAAATRAAARGPLNLNFFAHRLGEAPDETAWRQRLAPFYAAEGVVPPTAPAALRRSFDAEAAAVVEAVRPEIVSFHFGLPGGPLLARVRASGALLFGNATTLAEARWLAAQGCDAIIAQGQEAGGHAGHFLGGHAPLPLLALVRAVAGEIALPVIAAGGIVSAADVSAAMAAGAAAVQAGTAFLLAPESAATAVHRAALAGAGDGETHFTNLFTGGVARGRRNRLIDSIGPIDPAAPPFPYAAAALAPLRATAEADGRDDYSPLWAGTGVGRISAAPAADIVHRLGNAALAAQEHLA